MILETANIFMPQTEFHRINPELARGMDKGLGRDFARVSIDGRGREKRLGIY
jgi:hypothetical protein